MGGERAAGGVAQAVGPEFKPQYCKKKRKKKLGKPKRGQRLSPGANTPSF
jgi:hypothetical protein